MGVPMSWWRRCYHAQVAAGAHQQLDATRMAEGMRVKLGDPGTPA